MAATACSVRLLRRRLKTILHFCSPVSATQKFWLGPSLAPFSWDRSNTSGRFSSSDDVSVPVPVVCSSPTLLASPWRHSLQLTTVWCSGDICLHSFMLWPPYTQKESERESEPLQGVLMIRSAQSCNRCNAYASSLYRCRRHDYIRGAVLLSQQEDLHFSPSRSFFANRNHLVDCELLFSPTCPSVT